MPFTLEPIRAARIDWQSTTPFASDYGDSYFMPEQGPAESLCVFIEANALAERFAGLPGDGLFVIGETGFGTGLNVLLAAECFLQNAPASARLHVASAEKHPLTRNDLARALAHWPDLAGLGQRLLDQWPPPAPGFHRLQLHDRVELTLMLGDAAVLWPAGPDGVDAWFLDGFAPERNPDMWTDELIQTVFSRSRPGATAATFTAAGAVRRSLAAAGFRVERQAGFGAKRHRLTARAPGRWSPRTIRRGTALVVGAGPAGCTQARALAERGWRVQVFDPALDTPTPPHLAAVLYASASHHLNAQNRFHLDALLHARRWLNRLGFPRDPSDGRLEDIVQHLVDPRVASKTRRALASGSWPSDLLQPVEDDAVRITGTGFLNTAAWCRTLLDHEGITARAERVTGAAGGASPCIRTDSGRMIEGDAVVLCAAGATRGFKGLGWLPLRIVRGQVTFCRATEASTRWRRPQCHTGYVTPAIDGVHCVGATFDRQREEAIVDPIDNARNLAELKRHLPARWEALGGDAIEIVGQHAGVRCQSEDMLPILGPCPDAMSNPHTVDRGLWLNLAYGSKGLTHTPLCADLLADDLSGQPLAADQDVIDSLAPERFVERRRKRDPHWQPECLKSER